MLVFVRFDLLSNPHDQKEYDKYFVISREENMLATLKNKNEIIYSLANPFGKNKPRYPINKKKNKKQRSPTAWQSSHTRLQEDKKLYSNDSYNKHV